MNIYPILVFLHVVGAVGIFVAFTIEAVALAGLQRAERTADARVWMTLLRPAGRFAPIASLVTLVTGIWMMVKWWGPRPWIQFALVTVVAMAIFGGGVTGRRMRRLGPLLPAEMGETLSPAFRSVSTSRALAASLRARIAGGVGILALMTLKPDLAGSLIITGLAIGVGVLASVRSWRRSEAQSILEWKGVRS